MGVLLELDLLFFWGGVPPFCLKHCFFVFFGFLLNFVVQHTFVISCTVFLIYCISNTDA